MSESSEVEDGGVATAVGSTYASAAKSPIRGGGRGGAPKKDSTLGALYRRKEAPIGATI